MLTFIMYNYRSIAPTPPHPNASLRTVSAGNACRNWCTWRNLSPCWEHECDQAKAPLHSWEQHIDEMSHDTYTWVCLVYWLTHVLHMVKDRAVIIAHCWYHVTGYKTRLSPVCGPNLSFTSTVAICGGLVQSALFLCVLSVNKCTRAETAGGKHPLREHDMWQSICRLCSCLVCCGIRNVLRGDL